MAIDWSNPDSRISSHFTVHEALWLPSWSRMATEADGLTDDIKANLVALFSKIDTIRDKAGPLVVNCAYRPPAYNKLIGGAEHSAHILGKAVDFHAVNEDINSLKDIIVKNDLLESLNVRMESAKGAPTWCHIGNDYVVGHNRIFDP